ncbi:PEP-CTERM sorting domain-containing protein [Thalassomonas viridans]|uniref:PEP-CTERM sorting domain-containing protein n=1 Tax=Thalassomonas viridans TaxID=137584 RepID=A0AAE9Z075_9GAMM|nr:PEP-CTERM sorting domain-containing protein [Thalassomonas viridans]WDE02792.1 PEP-CTERM sorting domain-containing protein [Thalassomonas viridans]
MKSKLLQAGLLLSAGCFVNLASAGMLTSIDLVTDNGSWPTVPSGFVDGSAYDGFTLTVEGQAGEVMSDIHLTLNFSGLFDDSLAIDLDGDGTIDFALDFYNIHAQSPGYTPWSDAGDVANTVTRLTIGATGSSASVSVYDTDIILDSVNYDSFDNLAAITLEDLGFGAGGTILEGGRVTTSEMRFGYINTAGPGSGMPEITSESFSQGVDVPEPASAALLALAIMGLSVRRQKK